MIEPTLRVEGIEDLDKAMERLIKSMPPSKVEPVLKEAGEVVKDYGQPITPYDPKRKEGIHLRDGWKVKILRRFKEDQAAPAIVAMDEKKTPHAHLLEFGTVKMAARPYFRPAWDATKNTVKRMIIDNLRKMVEAVGQ